MSQNLKTAPEIDDNYLQQYLWPDNFWPEFIDSYWEQKPGIFKNPAAKPFISLEELFTAVTNMPSRVASDRFWIAKNTPAKKFKDFTMGSLNMFGPQKSDKDFNGYFKRLNRHSAGINIHNLDKASPGLWDRVQGFMKYLNKVPGRPPAMNWDLDTFFGTYRATPFGIHKDPASVFAFGLLGERTYCTWDSDYFEPGDPALQTPDLNKIEPHLKNADMFTLKPGQVFYWSSNSWHVVLSNGKPSAVAQISAYFRPKDLKHWHHKTPGY